MISNNNSQGGSLASFCGRSHYLKKQSNQTNKKNCPAEYQLTVFEPIPDELCSVWVWLEEETADLRGLGSRSKAVNPGRKGQPASKAAERGEKLEAQGEALRPC